MQKLVIAESFPYLRSSIQQLLETVPGVEVVAETSSGQELLKYCREADWDVAILGVSVFDRTPVELAKALRQAWPDRPVVAVSFRLDPPTLRTVIDLGINGLLASETIADELPKAVQTVLLGQPYLSRPVEQMVGRGSHSLNGA